MKKLLFIAFTIISTLAFGQNDITRTNPVGSNPANTSTYNKQSVRDANLTAVLNLRIPVYSSFSLRNAKDSLGYVMYNSSIGRMGIYKGGGVWDTISSNNTSSLLNYYTKTQSDAIYTPLTRLLTINGVSYDLSANRTWNVGTVTSVASGYGILGGPITTTGTFTADTASSDGLVSKSRLNYNLSRLVPYTNATQDLITNFDVKADTIKGNAAVIQGDITTRNGSGHVFYNNGNTSSTSLYANGGSDGQFFTITLPAADGTVVLGSDLANYVPTYRTISVGTGLLGGGDLSTNRTISADTTVLRSAANSLNLAQTQSALNLKENLANKATDFSTVNNTLYPTVQAVKSYADGLVVGLLNDRGSYDPTATSAYPTTGGSGAGGAIKKGDIWYISANGTIGGITVLNGYSVRALADSPAQVAANWNILQVGLGYVPENVANKVTDLTGPDNTKYPTSLAVSTALDTKQSVLSGTGLVKSTSGTISYITDNSTNWNTAYSYSQIGHLPLSGGALTGALNGTMASFSVNANGSYVLSALNTNTSGSGAYIRGGDNAGTTNVAEFANAAGATQMLIRATGTTLYSPLTGTSATFNSFNENLMSRITGLYSFGSGKGLEMQFDPTANIGYVFAYNRSISTVLDLSLGSTSFPVFLKGSNGNVLINTTTDAGYKLDVNGTLRVTGNANFANNIYINGASEAGHVLSLGGVQKFQAYVSASGYNLYNYTTSLSAFNIAHSNSAVTFYNLIGSGDRLVVTNSSGTLITAVIGSGLSYSGGVLSATGGSSGTVTGTGTAGYIPKWNSASDIGNSIISESGTTISVAGIIGANRVDVKSGNSLLLWNPSNSEYTFWNTDASNNAIWGVGGITKISFSSAGTITASSFSGAGTGLTGTAASLTAGSANLLSGYALSFTPGVGTVVGRDASGYSWFNYINSNTSNGEGGVISQFITTNGTDGFYRKQSIGQVQTALGLGSAAYTASSAYYAAGSTVVNSTNWGIAGTYGGLYSSGTIQYGMVYNSTNSRWEAGSSSHLQAFLGLGSNAYTSTTYAPLNSPGFTGTPTAPTPAAGDNSTKIATTEFIANATGRVLLRSTTTFSGTGLGSSQDYNTGIASGSLLLLTAGSSDAAGAGYYVVKNPGCGGLCDEWHIIFPNGAPIGTSNITFYYVVLQ